MGKIFVRRQSDVTLRERTDVLGNGTIRTGAVGCCSDIIRTGCSGNVVTGI